MKRTTIRNCFRASGFILDDADEDILSDEDICANINILDRWSLISVHNENIPTFDEIVHFDDDVLVAKMLTDSEILTEEVDEEENVQTEENNFIHVSVKKTRSVLQNLPVYFTTEDVSQRNIFDISFNENRLDCVHWEFTQTKITDYFKK